MKGINKFLVCTGLVFSLCSNAFALDTTVTNAIKNHLPGSTMPGVINNILSPSSTATPAAPHAITQHKEKENGLTNANAQKIKFKLNEIKLEGNHVYTEKQIKPLYQTKLHTTISVADLQNIVQDITNYYRNNGYILTRAVLPPQKVHDGIVQVRVIEGYISKVSVIGKPDGAKKMLEKYGTRISQDRPLNVALLERYLRLSNEIPGVQAKSVLEPSKIETGASDLSIVSDMKKVEGYVSYDNYGTLYIGPNQVTTTANVNSVIRSGDMSKIFYITTTRPEELKFLELTHQTPLGSDGATFTIDGNSSRTEPGLNLRPLKIRGNGETFYGMVHYPVLRTRTHDMNVDGSFNYIDSQVTTGVVDPVQNLYTDHLRTFRFGGNDTFSDRFAGINFADIHFEQGANLFGATNSVTTTTTSRFGGRGVFTKMMAQYSRTQQIYGRFSGYFYATGQYALNPLLASEQFSFGGSQAGRGYDPAEIIGDRGLGGTVELRMDVVPGWRLLESTQTYVFYDQGAIWNLKNVVGVLKKQSIASTGLGVRIGFMPHLSGNFMLAQPLTKQIAAEEVVGNGRRLRGFFSVTATL